MTRAELQKFFPLHSRVLLNTCPHGQPGTIIGWNRGRVLVCFHDLNLTGQHDPASLLRVKD